MVARVRPIRWELLLDPSMRGLETEARSSENLSRSIMGGLTDIGQGIARGRQEKESRRRFERVQGREDAEFSLRKEELLEKKRDRQAYETDWLDSMDLALEAAGVEVETTGTVSPQTTQVVTDLTDALGGPEATKAKVEAREAACGPDDKT